MERLDIAVTGGCQCGAVRYRSDQLMDNAHICHCRMCQKAVGNFFAALVGAPNDRLEWTRGAPAVFASSDLANAASARHVGRRSSIAASGARGPALTIGSLDDPSLAPPHVQVGMEGRYAFMDDLLHLPDSGATEEDMEEEAPLIAASNHQHPDHDTDTWPQ